MIVLAISHTTNGYKRLKNDDLILHVLLSGLKWGLFWSSLKIIIQVKAQLVIPTVDIA